MNIWDENLVITRWFYVTNWVFYHTAEIFFRWPVPSGGPGPSASLSPKLEVPEPPLPLKHETTTSASSYRVCEISQATVLVAEGSPNPLDSYMTLYTNLAFGRLVAVLVMHMCSDNGVSRNAVHGFTCNLLHAILRATRCNNCTQ